MLGSEEAKNRVGRRLTARPSPTTGHTGHVQGGFRHGSTRHGGLPSGPAPKPAPAKAGLIRRSTSVGMSGWRSPPFGWGIETPRKRRSADRSASSKRSPWSALACCRFTRIELFKLLPGLRRGRLLVVGLGPLPAGLGYYGPGLASLRLSGTV